MLSTQGKAIDANNKDINHFNNSFSIPKINWYLNLMIKKLLLEVHVIGWNSLSQKKKKNHFINSRKFKNWSTFILL